jgi:hypothetical protein
VRIPFGQDRRYLNQGGLLDHLVGGWSVSAIVQIQGGFPMGVTQSTATLNLNGGTQRPNVVSGADFVVPGDITERLRTNPLDNRYLNPNAFSLAPAYTYGNAPRILPGVRSPWRNSVDLRLNKEFRTGGSTRATVGVEILNLTARFSF